MVFDALAVLIDDERSQMKTKTKTKWWREIVSQQAARLPRATMFENVVIRLLDTRIGQADW